MEISTFDTMGLQELSSIIKRAALGPHLFKECAWLIILVPFQRHRTLLQ